MVAVVPTWPRQRRITWTPLPALLHNGISQRRNWQVRLHAELGLVGRCQYIFPPSHSATSSLPDCQTYWPTPALLQGRSLPPAFHPGITLESRGLRVPDTQVSSPLPQRAELQWVQQWLLMPQILFQTLVSTSFQIIKFSIKPEHPYSLTIGVALTPCSKPT